MTLQEAAQQALEALELTADRMQKQRDAITALRAAIAEASGQDVQQEMDCYGDGNVYRGQRSADSQIQTILVPPRREWAGLTDEEMRQAAQAMDAEPLAEGWKELIKFARAIEAKLKEKNDDK